MNTRDSAGATDGALQAASGLQTIAVPSYAPSPLRSNHGWHAPTDAYVGFFQAAITRVRAKSPCDPQGMKVL